MFEASVVRHEERMNSRWVSDDESSPWSPCSVVGTVMNDDSDDYANNRATSLYGQFVLAAKVCV